MKSHPLIQQAGIRAVNQVKGFASAAADITAAQLYQWYKAEIDAAPLRALEGHKSYFVGHSGLQEKEHFRAGTEGGVEGRKEEHLAIALFNEYEYSTQGFATDRDETVHFLDYQLPLKAKSDDKFVGKADLLALTSAGRLAVVELKYMPVRATVSRADTPLRAFLEGLAYCAILEADLECLHQEAVNKFKLPIEKKSPALIVLANDEYWKLYLESKAAGAWTAELQRLATGVEDKLNISVSFLSLSIPEEPVRYEDGRPKFIKPPQIERAW
jgi:hypothetical protein